MGNNNKSVKDAMIKKYGKKCFIEELGLRTKEEIERDLAKYEKSKRKELCMLTFHHIRERCRGGDASESNGAILRNINHIWFNGLSRERQREINNLFQEYKLNFQQEIKNKLLLGVAELYNGKVEQTQVIEAVEPEPEEQIIIPAFDFEISREEYEKYINKRRERERIKWREMGHGYDWER